MAATNVVAPSSTMIRAVAYGLVAVAADRWVAAISRSISATGNCCGWALVVGVNGLENTDTERLES